MNQNEANKEEKYELNTANIMVAGKTGTGKSTLLNAIFGEELAGTGTGRPKTSVIDDYPKGESDIPIHIWDTVGLEIDSVKTRQSIEEIKRTIASKSESKDELDQIHAIWYCINSGSNRYEGAELDFIKELYSIGVPFTIVLTQCYGAKKKIAEFEEEINSINHEMGLDGISIIKVLAQEYEVEIDDDTIIAKPPFGLEELVNATIEQLPSYVQSGFIAAQKVSEALKHVECEKLIWDYVRRVRDNYWSKLKIINWDNVPIINMLTTDGHIKDLFRDISRIYNTEIPEDGLDEIMRELGGLSFENAVKGLLSPVSNKFDADVKRLYETNATGDFDKNYNSLPKGQRVARMIVLYGYTFLEAIEDYWGRLREEKIENLRTKIDILVGIIREKCKVLNGRVKNIGSF